MACENLVAIVTGGAQGIGQAISKELLKNGYQVCIVDINESEGNSTVQLLQKEFGEKNVIFRSCDVSQSQQLKDVFEHVFTNFKRVDVLVNNAGILDESNPDKLIRVNLMSVIYGCDLAFKYMGKDEGGRGGIVINTASSAGLYPPFTLPVYCAAKCGVVGITRSFGSDYYLEKSGITFCALCPRAVDTNLLLGFAPRIDGKIFKELLPKEKPLLECSFVAKAALKLIEDKKNGSCLYINEKGYKYIPCINPEELAEGNEVNTK